LPPTSSLFPYTTLFRSNEVIYSPANFPDDGLLSEIREPWVSFTIITPVKYLGNIMPLLYEHEAELGESENFGEDRTRLFLKMPRSEEHTSELQSRGHLV